MRLTKYIVQDLLWEWWTYVLQELPDMKQALRNSKRFDKLYLRINKFVEDWAHLATAFPKIDGNAQIRD